MSAAIRQHSSAPWTQRKTSLCYRLTHKGLIHLHRITPVAWGHVSRQCRKHWACTDRGGMEGENGHELLSFQDAKSLAFVAKSEQTLAARLKKWLFFKQGLVCFSRKKSPRWATIRWSTALMAFFTPSHHWFTLYQSTGNYINTESNDQKPPLSLPFICPLPHKHVYSATAHTQEGGLWVCSQVTKNLQACCKDLWTEVCMWQSVCERKKRVWHLSMSALLKRWEVSAVSGGGG